MREKTSGSAARVEVIEPVKAGIIGVGEAILEYSYPSLRKLENAGSIRLVCIADKNDINGTKDNLESRREKYPRERKAIDDILGRFSNNDLKHYQTHGGRFNSSSNGVLKCAEMFYLATPNNVRIGLVEEIAHYGKNLIIEKPIGHTNGIVNDIADIITKGRIKSICAEHYSYKDPSLNFFRDFEAKTENFGKITSIEGFLIEDDMLDAERYFWLLDPSLSGGGIWLDTGCHMMHLLYSTGAMLDEVLRAKSYVYPFGRNDPKYEIVKSETAADVLLKIRGDNGRIDNNAYGHIVVAKCKQKPLKYFKVCFERGEVFLDFIKNSISYTDRTRDKAEFHEELINKTDPYENMLLNFLEFLKKDKEPPTIMNRIKASTDAVFKVYGKMEKGHPGEFY